MRILRVNDGWNLRRNIDIEKLQPTGRSKV